MLRRQIIALLAAAAASPAIAKSTGVGTMTRPEKAYAPINSLELYYEIHGTGEPLVMLHGGIGATEMFGPNLDELAKTRQVIIPHMQGHGLTKDINRPYSYPQFADDTAALLDHLNIGKADVLGYSLGAGVAFRLAIQHPAKVRNLISVSGTLRRDGQYPEVVAAFPDMVTNAAEIGAGVAASPMADKYPDIDWTTAFHKMGELETEAWDWTAEASGIESPILLIFADADSISGNHIVSMYQTFDGFQRDASFDGSLRAVSQLAVLPGRTHYDIMETIEVAALVERFLKRTSN